MSLHIAILSAFISYYLFVLIFVGIKIYVDRKTLFKDMDFGCVKEIIDKIIIKNKYSIKIRNIIEDKFADTKPCVQLREIIIQNQDDDKINNNKKYFNERLKQFNINYEKPETKMSFGYEYTSLKN
jgi:hypothetical protein